jgi:hypothetical protein
MVFVAFSACASPEVAGCATVHFAKMIVVSIAMGIKLMNANVFTLSGLFDVVKIGSPLFPL